MISVLNKNSLRILEIILLSGTEGGEYTPLTYYHSYSVLMDTFSFTHIATQMMTFLDLKVVIRESVSHSLLPTHQKGLPPGH